MTIEIPDIYSRQVNSILSKLPQTPFVVDVVGKAIQISCDENKNNEKFLSRLLFVADKVAKYTGECSSPVSYKYALIASILLAGIPQDKYAVIDTTSNTVSTAVKLITDFIYTDSFKEKWIILNQIAKHDSDLLYVVFCYINAEIENILAQDGIGLMDRVILTGYAYIEVSLRKSAITVPNRQYTEYNHFMSLMMKKVNF